MPRSILLTRALTALLASLLAFDDSCAADPLSPAAAATLMLTKGWAKTKAAQDVVNEQKLDVPPLKDHSLVRAAHWLVLMYQGRFNPAFDSVDVFLDKHPTSIDGLQAEIWMDMVGQDYEAAIVAAQKLGEVIAPPQKPGEKTAAASAASDDIVYFLGHVAGFLEGPANKLNDAERRKFETLLLVRLSPDQKEIFQAAKKDVIDQFRAMQEQAGDLKQNAEQEKATPKQGKASAAQDKQEQIYEKGKELAQAQAKVAADAQKAADDLKRKIADLERQDAPLQEEWRRLKNQLIFLNNLKQQQEDQIKRLDQEAADPKNQQAQNARNSANAARTQLGELNARLTFTNNEILRVEAAHQRLVQQGLIGQWQFQNEGQKLEGRQQELGEELRKAENLRRRMSHVKPPAEPDTKALENKAKVLQREALAFETYDRFPFEELRAKLLKAMR